MILIALGANLPSRFGDPADTLLAAIEAIEARNIKVLQSSRIWLTAPVPFDADQDWYHNSVIAVETNLSPLDLLQRMFDIEVEFGRVRDKKNEPRVLDLDLIAYHDEIIVDGERLILPHPRMHERLFVLKPLQDINENWVHPKSGQNVDMMLRHCSKDQQAKPIEELGEMAQDD